MSLVMYTGDLKPDLKVVCSADDPVNLTTATNVRIIGKRGTVLVFDRTPTLAVSGNTTVATMLWVAGDTDNIGRIQIEVEATWPGGKKQTFRADGGVDIRRDFDQEALLPPEPDLVGQAADAFVEAVLDYQGDAYDHIVSIVEDTVEAHTPGIELGFAERNTTFTTTATADGASALISGLSVTVVGQGRPVDIEFYAPGVYHSVANTVIHLYLAVNGVAFTANGNMAATHSPVTTTGNSVIMKRRAVLTDGVSYTFTVGAYGLAAGTTTLTAVGFALIQLAVTSR